jgi:hypothetical protein
MGLFSKLFAKSEPEPRIVVEQRAWVMVYDVPVGEGWHRVEDERRGDGFVVNVIKLVRTDAKLVLLAKDYEGDDIETIEELEARDWTEQYTQILGEGPRIEITKTEQTLMDRAVPALDITASSDSDVVRERYAIVPGHRFIVTAIGAAGAHEKYAADIEKWFAGVAFRAQPSINAST